MSVCGKRSKAYSLDDLEIFNLVEKPLWVFDVTEKAMWWANSSALDLWNAESLDVLLSRNFADDMSEATARRLSEYMLIFKNGGKAHDQWTYYPQGKGATTVHVILSGIQILDSKGQSRLMMLNEGVLPANDVAIDQESLRGVEMLRHLPVAVCQFDLEGNLMSQNPESLELFGSPAAVLDQESLCSFGSRFVDKQVGTRALRRVLQDKDYCVEAQLKTKKRGRRWFSISLRLSKDPVTSQPVVLYSALDNTDVVNAKEEAERANAERAEFFAVVSHELRTPLHQVIGFVDLLALTLMTDSQREYVRQMESASLSLMAVINDLLDYTKIETGKLKLEKVPLDVKGILEGCRQVMLPKANEKNLTLSCHWPAELPAQLIGDPNRLRQILLNLLQNSIKFTNSGEVSLSVTNVTPVADGGARVRFQVADTGIGILKIDQEQIFCKYQHATVAIARRFGGIGLGLPICKSLAEAMGGKIELQSELGKGTKVEFEIPFAAACDQPILSDEPVPTDATQRLRVLVAEDNGINQKMIEAMLRRMGHTVTLASDGALAVKAVEENKGHPFDVILMDQQMPVMDGIEATKVLRSKGYCEGLLPIVGLTASYQPAKWQYYRDCGMNDCIGKPAKLQTLRQILGNMHKLKVKTVPCCSCGGVNHQQRHCQMTGMPRIPKENFRETLASAICQASVSISSPILQNANIE